jgi:hypothetical protein
MNTRKAYEILGLREEDTLFRVREDEKLSERGSSLSEDVLKKAYRAKILQYHPDKNHSPDSAEKFIEVKEAYIFLQKNEEPQINEPYNDMLKTFLSSVFREETELVSKLIEVICKKICMIVDNNTDHIIYYLRTINRDNLRMIHSVLSKYKHILHFSSEIFEKIEEILEENACIILNPTLDNLMSSDNVYILKHETKSYLVPLWHHEMTFENEPHNITVKCFPVLPDNMVLDEYNVLIVRLQYYLHDIWGRNLTIEIGSKLFEIKADDLRLTSRPQTIEYIGRGVPYNNVDDAFDDSTKQPVVFIVTILQ